MRIRRLTNLVARSLLVTATLGCHGGVGDGDAPSPAAVQRGEVLYRAHGCTVCHGPSGRGDGPSAVTLNPGPRDFRDLPSYRQGTGTQDITETLRTGVLKATRQQMPAYGHLSESDRHALAAYVVSIQGKH